MENIAITKTEVEIIANGLLLDCILIAIPNKTNDQMNANNSIHENTYAAVSFMIKGDGFEKSQYFPNNANSSGRIITKNKTIGIWE